MHGPSGKYVSLLYMVLIGASPDVLHDGGESFADDGPKMRKFIIDSWVKSVQGCKKKHFSSDQQFKGEICPSDRFAGTFGNFLCSSAGACVSTKGCGEFHTSIGGREMKFCLFEVFGATDRGGRKWKGRASAHSSSKMSVCEREKGGVEGHAQGKPIRVRIYFREAENR